MVDGLHVPIWNRTKKPLAIVLNEMGKVLRVRGDGGELTNVHHKPNQRQWGQYKYCTV
jgi:hypothetical protein